MTTGGTVNYVDGYPRSQGSSPAQWRDHAFLGSVTVGGTSSINKFNEATREVPLLPYASSVGGGNDCSSAYYIIRGFMVGSTKATANVFMGVAFETNVDDQTHAPVHSQLAINDADGVIFNWSVTKFGPCSISFPQPIRLSKGAGLSIECYNKAVSSGTNGNSVTVFYSLINI